MSITYGVGWMIVVAVLPVYALDIMVLQVKLWLRGAGVGRHVS